MGGYDFTLIGDLMGLYVLNTHSRIVDAIQIGLYHIDGIIYIPNNDGPKCSSTQKNDRKSF